VITCRSLSSRSAGQGFVLLAVLVFILLLSMIAVSVLFRSQADETAGQAISGAEQAWSAAMSGVEEAIRVAAAVPPGCTDWEDDPSLFRARKVYLDGGEQWYFTVFSTADSDSLADVRYGLSDEAGRLNLNHLGDADLTKIPGMTPTLEATLRQFIGEAPKPAGTNAVDEISLASEPVSLDPGQILYTNEMHVHGPLATLDELLLVPGFTRALFHGAPPAGDDQSLSSTNADGPQFSLEITKPKRSRGLDQYFTVLSRDPNRSSAGRARCNLNDSSAALPDTTLPAGFSNYVAVARAGNHRFAHPSETLEATIKAKDDHGVETEISSGISKENLAEVLDLFATDADSGYDGLVNVNTASPLVLATLPGIDLPLAEAIVSTRTGMSPERRATIAWLYQEGVVDAAKFKTIAPRLTARSTQFRFSVIGYGLPSGRYRVLEVVIDLGSGDPRIAYLRDITRRGLPIRLKEENPAELDILGAAGRVSTVRLSTATGRWWLQDAPADAHG
jgi:hypothetical protein